MEESPAPRTSHDKFLTPPTSNDKPLDHLKRWIWRIYTLYVGLPGTAERQRFTAVFIFSAVAALLYADQNLMAPNLTAIARDFGMSDQERDRWAVCAAGTRSRDPVSLTSSAPSPPRSKLAGQISVVFFLVGAPAAVIAGYLCGVMDRRLLLLICVLLGEVGSRRAARGTPDSHLDRLSLTLPVMAGSRHRHVLGPELWLLLRPSGAHGHLPGRLLSHRFLPAGRYLPGGPAGGGLQCRADCDGGRHGHRPGLSTSFA